MSFVLMAVLMLVSGAFGLVIGFTASSPYWIERENALREALRQVSSRRAG